MESVLGRYRNLIILVGVLFLQVLGLAMQVKRMGNEAQDTRLIRIWAVGSITPFERGLVWMQTSTRNIWHNYFYLRGVRAENRDLKAQIEQMRLEQVRLSEDAAQARRLQNLLAFKEQFVAKTVAAQVIGSSGSDFSRIIYIDKGENSGIRRDMAVITPDGVVGKVALVYSSAAQVLLINDQTSGVGVIMADSRLDGWLGGSANGEVVMNDVMSDEDVPVGARVLTSGGDQIFPKGLPVGTVAKVMKGKDLFLNIKIKPTADLSKLEEVLVVVEKQEKQATADDKARVRAADILAQRLPSVPDRPTANAASVGIAPEGAAKPAGSANSLPAAKTPAATTSSLAAKSATSSTGTAPAIAPRKTGDQTSTAPLQNQPAGSATTKPSVVPPKPAISQPKPPTPPTTQPGSQPAADDNSPH